MARSARSSILYVCALVLFAMAALADAKRVKKLQQEETPVIESFSDYVRVGLKTALAFSPIIGIGLLLACAREDDKTEMEKTAKKKPKG